MSWTRRRSLYLLVGIVLILLLSVPILIHKRKDFPRAAWVGDFSKSRGFQTAPITLVEYSDFQCSSCQTVQPLLKEILEKYPGKIRLVFRHFPLSTHKYSSLAHQAAECANEQGQFWLFHDRLYQNQMVWSSVLDPLETFFSYAKELGLDQQKFLRCLGDPETAERVRADLISGKSAGVTSTPTFFLGDKMLVGNKQFSEEINSWIQKELAEKKQ